MQGTGQSHDDHSAKLLTRISSQLACLRVIHVIDQNAIELGFLYADISNKPGKGKQYKHQQPQNGQKEK